MSRHDRSEDAGGVEEGEAARGDGSVNESLKSSSGHSTENPSDATEPTQGSSVLPPSPSQAQKPKDPLGRAADVERAEIDASLLEDVLVVDATVGDFDTIAPAKATSGDTTSSWRDGQQVAGRFRIQRFVAQGGMGKVYFAHDEMLGRLVALKRIPAEIIFDGDARDDLRQEANRLLDLAHDNIVRIHTYYDGPTWPFIAMEVLQGPTLKKLLRQRKQYGRGFSTDEVLRIAAQVARGLSHAHAKGIIHRDLKPANLMLAQPVHGEIGDEDVVKITDFGISRVVADSTLRQTGRRSGTLPYMSPEQFRGEACTPKSDIYSFACTLYELVGGSPAFHTGDIGYQILNVTPKLPSRVPRALAKAILRGMDKDPARRYESAEEFLDALEGRHSLLSHGMRRGMSKVAMGGRMVVAAGLLVLLTWGVVSMLWNGPGLGPFPEARLPSEEVTLTDGAAFVAPFDAGVTDVTQDGERLFRALRERFPKKVGPELRETRWDSGTLTLELSLPAGTLPHELGSPSSVFLEYYRSDSDDGFENPRQATLNASDDGASLQLVLDGLEEGHYNLHAFVRPRAEGGAVGEPVPLFRDPFRFEVDQTAPDFEVGPLVTEDFIRVRRGLTVAEDDVYSTFLENVTLTVQSLLGTSYLPAARWRFVHGRQDLAWTPVSDPGEFVVSLAPGSNTVQVEVEDIAGNVSPIKTLHIRRLKLEMERFELASEVVGNVASVRGLLRVEGDRRPQLRYLVNGNVVQPLESRVGVGAVTAGAVTAGAVTAGAPDLGGESAETQVLEVPVAASLVLPKAINTLEVQYLSDSDEPRPFPRPVRIQTVKMRPPTFLTRFVLPRTRNDQVRFEATVEPYFEGLLLTADMPGRASNQIELVPNHGTSTASLSEYIDLQPDQENIVQLRFSYRGHEIESEDGRIETLRVVNDQIPPALAAPIHFEPVDRWLYVTLQPNEPLAKLRIHVGHTGASGEKWDTVEALPDRPGYLYRTTVPVEATRFRVEMTDLVGLETEVQDVYPPYSSAALVPGTSSVSDEAGPEFARFKAGEEGAESNLPGVSTRASLPPGVVEIRSNFLRSLGMDFRAVGPERLEMGVTEVSEQAWFWFLRETQSDAPKGSGRIDQPMVLGDRPPGLLLEFAEWFGRRSADGYEYFVPSVRDWLAGFSGEAHVAQAQAAIRSWFAGDRQDGSGFDPYPSTRYGWNRVKQLGRRTENTTPTGLLDMESNVQEVVRQGELFYVLGAHNGTADPALIQRYCLSPRQFEGVQSSLSGALTGFRLARRPAGTVED